jgi:hypothetical protein
MSPPWQSLTEAPLNGTMVWLAVCYEKDDADHPLADSIIAATVGFWQEGDGDEGEWLFAGWCWSHGHFTQGCGRVLAWKPIGFDLDLLGVELPTPAPSPMETK